MSVCKAVAGALFAAALCAPVVRAQRIHGTLMDSVTREPVAGAVVTLNDSAGTFLGRTLTDREGRFIVSAPPRAAQLHIVRIGYRPRDVAATRTDTLVELGLSPIPSMLAAVTASGKRVCPGETGGDGALEVWEQARAGLLATVIARQMQSPRLQLVWYNRTLDPVRYRITDDTSGSRSVANDHSYVSARPSWRLADEGYMREDINRDREYYAPDEAVLIDRTFAATHCLHVVPSDAKHAGQVGIAFDPIHDAARDTLVDIAGTLWVTDKGALRAVEFSYTNLERRATGSGGEIAFATMPNGVPMIVAWQIRTALIVDDETYMRNGVHYTPPPRPMRSDTRVLGWHETGGVVGAAEWPDGTRWQGYLPRAVGMVKTLSGEPVSGTRVWLRDTGDTATTAADGTFSLPYVMPGVYTLLASDSVLAIHGISRTIAQRWRLMQAGDTRVTLTLHPRSAVLSVVCPKSSYSPAAGVLIVTVIDAGGAPVPGARLDLETTQTLLVDGVPVPRARTASGQSDTLGKFVVCGASRDAPIKIHATSGDSSGDLLVDQWPDDVLSRTLRLQHTP